MSDADRKAWSKYEPTVARAYRPWSRKGFEGVRSIDLHGHAVAREALEFVRDHVPQAAPAPGPDPLANAVNALHDRDTRDVLAEPRLRLAQLDAMGIDLQVVWPTPHLHSYYELPAELSDKATRIANEGLAAFAAAAPDRLMAMGTVSMQDPTLSVAHLDQCAELGLRGIQLLGHIGSREISDPLFEPFWARAAALDMLIFVHGSGNNLNGRLKRHNFVNAIGNPLETTIALAHLISDGVLERNPSLRILGAHGAGYLGGYHGRGDHNWGARADGYNGLPHPPSFYLKRNVYFDSIVFTPEQLTYLINTYGSGHVVLGTDFPFNMGEFEPVEHLLSLPSVSTADKRAVLGETAAGLLGLA